MPRKISPQYNISSYQKKGNGGAVLIWILGAIMIGFGILILILWFTGDNSTGGISLNLFASKTPTATETITPSPTVPTSTPTNTPMPTDTLAPSMTPTPNGPQLYTVQEGDNCWDIAVKFGVDLNTLLGINGWTDCNIHSGDEITIPGPDTQLPTNTAIPLTSYKQGQQIEYKIELNDNIQAIAAKFNSTVDSIAKLNKIDDTAAPLRQGNTLMIEVNIVTPTPTSVPTSTIAAPTATKQK